MWMFRVLLIMAIQRWMPSHAERWKGSIRRNDEKSRVYTVVADSGGVLRPR
jgi:hypothetical protein